jgi:hypothetical protein
MFVSFPRCLTRFPNPFLTEQCYWVLFYRTSLTLPTICWMYYYRLQINWVFLQKKKKNFHAMLCVTATQLSALRNTEACTAKSPWSHVNRPICTLYLSLQYLQVTKSSRGGPRAGNHAGQLPGPPLPVHCPPAVWFGRCLTMQTTCRVPSCMNTCVSIETRVPEHC